MNYQDKYLKYKNKYIKIQQGGIKSNWVQTTNFDNIELKDNTQLLTNQQFQTTQNKNYKINIKIYYLSSNETESCFIIIDEDNNDTFYYYPKSRQFKNDNPTANSRHPDHIIEIFRKAEQNYLDEYLF